MYIGGVGVEGNDNTFFSFLFFPFSFLLVIFFMEDVIVRNLFLFKKFLFLALASNSHFTSALFTLHFSLPPNGYPSNLSGKKKKKKGQVPIYTYILHTSTTIELMIF